MIKRIVCSLAAVMVLTSSFFAWDAYSFTGVYDVASASSPVFYSPSSSDSIFVPSSLPSSVSSNFSVYTADYSYTEVPPYFTTETLFWGSLVSVPVQPQLSNYLHFVSGYEFDYTVDSSDQTDKTYGFYLLCNDYYHPVNYSKVTGVLPVYDGVDYFKFSVNYDVSSYQASAFSLDGLLGMGLYCSGPQYFETFQRSVDVLVDGQLVRSFSGSSEFIDFAGYVYSGSSVIDTITFDWYIPFVGTSSESDSYNGSYRIFLRYTASPSFDTGLTISFLSNNSILDGFNDEAQNDINSHESIESQWTSSMSSNFDALDMDNFTFPSGLVSGFGLITGIFQDLWNAMGEYKILFVFPLTLGVALLLIGRISKFSGGQSSSRSNRGDDGA